mgnify:FL=1
MQFHTCVPAGRFKFLRRPHLPTCASLADDTRARLRATTEASKLDAAVEKLCSCGRSGMGPPEEGKSPMHGNYLTLLPSRHDPAEACRQVDMFISLCSRLDWINGAIVYPYPPILATLQAQLATIKAQAAEIERLKRG